MTISVTPEAFILTPYDNAEIHLIIEDVCAQIGFPGGLDIALRVDETLPHPIVGTNVDLVDGVVQMYVSGGNFEARNKSRTFSPVHARAEITHMLLRAVDRLKGGFERASLEADLTLGERQAWDTYTWGRVARLGHNVHEQKRRYDFRMQHGFNDAADAAYERLWAAESMTWDGVKEICAETGANLRATPKTPIDLLRQGV